MNDKVGRKSCALRSDSLDRIVDGDEKQLKTPCFKDLSFIFVHWTRSDSSHGKLKERYGVEDQERMIPNRITASHHRYQAAEDSSLICR